MSGVFYKIILYDVNILFMKIATNVERQMFGGIATSNLALLRSLEASGHTFIGIELPSERSIKGATMFWSFHPDFFQHRIIQVPDVWERFKIRNTHALDDIRAIWQPAVELLIDLLKVEKPDVVLLNGTYTVPWVLLQAAKSLKIPIVLRYAGVLTIETQGVADPHAREMYRLLEKSFMPNVDYAIFPSAVAKRVVEEVVTGYEIKNATVLPNPVFVPRLHYRSPNKQLVIGAVGRWSKVKNFQAFFRLHQGLRRQQTAHTARFITNHERTVRVPKTIEKIDSMGQSELWRFYRELDVLIVPSTFETFCNVAAEAVLSGTPVLVSETVGFSEVLQAFGLDDMVVPSFEKNSIIIDRVKRLSRRRVSFWTRRRLARYLDPNRVHRQIVDVLQDVINKKSR